MNIDKIINEEINRVLTEDSINAKKRNVKNVQNAFKQGKRGYNAIKTMAVFTAENPDSTAHTNGENKGFNKNLKKDLKSGNYAAFRVDGHFGNVEHPYMILNISQHAAATYCGKYEQTSFIFHILNNDGSIKSEYWEKKDVSMPYDENENPYILKDTSNSWVDESDADDYYTIVGRDFKYSIPFPMFESYNRQINNNLDRLIEQQLRVGGVTNKDALLEFSINKVGRTPYMYRKAIYKGLIYNN